MDLPSPSLGGSKSRLRVLDALEHGYPPTLRRLAALTGLDEKTTRHACRQLVICGILKDACSYGNQSIHPFPLDPVRYPVLPVLEADDCHLILRMGDTHLHSVLTSVRDKPPHVSREEALCALGEQVKALPAGGVLRDDPVRSICRPVILHRDDDPPSEAFLEQARRCLAQVGATAPLLPLPVNEVIARELGYHPACRDARLVLHIRLAASPMADFFTRNRTDGDFSPIPCADHWTKQLDDYLACCRTSSEALSRFLGETLRVLPARCVLLEVDAPWEIPVIPSHVLPDGTTVHAAATDLNTPSLAHRGALRISRRLLWETMMGEN